MAAIAPNLEADSGGFKWVAKTTSSARASINVKGNLGGLSAIMSEQLALFQDPQITFGDWGLGVSALLHS